MAQALIRGIEPAVLDKLKTHAVKNNRSLEAELRVVLQRAAMEPEARVSDDATLEKEKDILAEVQRIRALFDGPQFSDSAELLNEDRTL